MKVEGSWPDCARQHQIMSFFVNKGKFWCCLAQSGQLRSTFLQTSGAGSQIEPAIFWSGSVWDDFVWLVWSWCNHTINIFFESIFEKNKFHYYYCTTYYLRTLWISWVVWLVVVPRWRGAAIGRRPTTTRCHLVLKMFAVPVIILWKKVGM